MMFNHISLGVSDLKKSLYFYDKVMDILGHKRLFGSESKEHVAYGTEKSFFIVNMPLEPGRGAPTPCNGTHICFNAPDRKTVDAFYKTALEAGAICAGKPGLRTQYAPDYYAAFVFDPDGHKIEAVVGG